MHACICFPCQSVDRTSENAMPAFQYGLFGCFSNIGLCVITFVAPCYTAGKVAEKVGERFLPHFIITCFLPEIGDILQAMVRQKIRLQKNIEGSLFKDFCIHLWCMPCALVQEANEVGADISLDAITEDIHNFMAIAAIHND